jgi:hypothetical protein
MTFSIGFPQSSIRQTRITETVLHEDWSDSLARSLRRYAGAPERKSCLALPLDPMLDSKRKAAC